METNQIKPNHKPLCYFLLSAANVSGAEHGQMTLPPRRLRSLRLIVAFACLALLPHAIAAPGSWTQKADMPGQTSTPASCVVDGILYVMGGHYPYDTALKTVWAYDPKTDSWTRKTNMPTARRFAVAAAVDEIIYVVGGSGIG
jgi:hypothetical protein